MKIIWSDFSIKMFYEIFTYYKKNVSKSVANQIKSEILYSTNLLKKHPHLGQIEENLTLLQGNHRYIISGRFKIIYKEVKNNILITDIFDVRQDPDSLNEQNR